MKEDDEGIRFHTLLTVGTHRGGRIWPEKRVATGLFMAAAPWWLAAVLSAEADVQEGRGSTGQGRDVREKCRARRGRERRLRRRRRLWAHGKQEGGAQGLGRLGAGHGCMTQALFVISWRQRHCRAGRRVMQEGGRRCWVGTACRLCRDGASRRKAKGSGMAGAQGLEEKNGRRLGRSA
jgi:hypothetical protein